MNERHIENTTGEPETGRMTFAELEQTLRKLDDAGKEATLIHNDKFLTLEDDEEVDGLKRHLPGEKPGECKVCDEVVYSFEKFMELEHKYFGVSGVPLAEIITQMRLIRSIMKMVEDEKAANN